MVRPSPLVIPLLVFGKVFAPIAVHHAVVTFRRSGNQLVDGTIAGVLDVSELTDVLNNVAGAVSFSFCGNAFEGIADQIKEAKDIFSDGTNAPGVPCNAISIGLGFTARQVANPTKVAPDQLNLVQFCNLDAGADAAAD